MRIEILCTGDEVLTGKITNTNFGYISQKLEDVGLSVFWGTTVGDDRDSLLTAFRLAGERADAVIVNGGLGPTVDDLSQEIAARAAGVELVLSEDWLKRMEAFFARRSRVMGPNNRKQAMIPAGAEILDNPIGTACGFAMDIGKARFFFTPGVPRELHRMLEGEIIPRLLARSGEPTVIHLKRFHSYGLGESHVDALLNGLEAMVPDGSVKLGFRAHYPQLETKLTVRGKDRSDVTQKLAPVEAEVRKRVGNFILAEDDKTLEGVVLAALAERHGSLALVETFTSGQIAARIAPLPGAEAVFRRGIVARTRADVLAAVGLPDSMPADNYDRCCRGGCRRRPRGERCDPRTRGADRSRRRRRPHRFRRQPQYRDRDRRGRRASQGPYRRRPRLGAAGRRRDGTGLPAPASARPARV
jgi:nicotinamide-nucleotide amidase